MPPKGGIMAYKKLKVLIAGNVAGDLLQNNNGSISFTYDANYRGTPLSFSMPIANRTYTDKQVRPYLFGLLPDDPAVRHNLGIEFGASGNNPFALLEHIGLDCPGAIQFCPESQVETTQTRTGILEPISDTEIAERLAQGRMSSAAAWIDPHEHWSLGGQQSKFALRLESGQWHRCLGSAATTHIFKGGISHLEHQALNEYLCLKLAEACNIPAAHATYQIFNQEPAIVIERYDRTRDTQGNVLRLHQEDFCQILGVLPENKYPEYGGPSASDVLRVLALTGHKATNNVAMFVQMLFFNYLLGAPDAHAKNYSLMLDGYGDGSLAPLYDIASVLPYVRPRERMRTAMSIGGENRIGHLKRSSIKNFVQSNQLSDFNLDEIACVDLLTFLAQLIPQKFEEVFEREQNVPGVNDLRTRFEQPVSDLCKMTLQMLHT